MESHPSPRGAVFAPLLDVWHGGGAARVDDVITSGYAGHLLHLVDGERTAATYAKWIEDYHSSNADVTFEVVDQLAAASRLRSRLVARRPCSHANGMNLSRLEGDLIAEGRAIWSDGHDDGDPRTDPSAVLDR